MKPTQYLAVDVETTGLDPDRHSILEIAAMPVDDNFKKRAVEPFHTRVRPLPCKSIDPKAIEVNGMTWAVQGAGPEWDSALDYAQAQIEFKKYIAEHFGQAASFIVLVGWNVSFDEGFLMRLYTYYNGSTDKPTMDTLEHAKWPFHYHKMDLMGVCRYLDTRAGRTRRSYRLAALADQYNLTKVAGLSHQEKLAMHTAIVDCEMQLRVLEAVERDPNSPRTRATSR